MLASTSWLDLDSKLQKYAIENRIPLNGEFELTARCNLKCKMCYVCESVADLTVSQYELSAKEWLSFAKEARDAGMLYLLLTGGEIFVHPDFKEIYEGLSEMGLIITLFTNGTLISEEVADWLSKIPPHKVSITLYGASYETYEKVTGNGNAFYKVIKAIDLLLERNVNVELKTTIIKDNVNDFEKIFDYAQSVDVRFGIVNYIFSRRDNKQHLPLQERLNPKELVDFEIKAEQYMADFFRGKPHSNKSDYSIFETKQKEHLIIKDSDNALKCHAGQVSFWAKWDASLIPCGLMELPKVNFRNCSFLEAWEALGKEIRSIPVSEECMSCNLKDHCMSCPARLFGETEKFDRKADYLCQHALYSSKR